jgi:hypothetical protein
MSQLIQNSLAKEIETFLSPYLKEFHEYRIDNFCNGSITVIGKVKELDCAETIVIRLYIIDEEIQIPNIFMPDFMKEKNIGKELISIIYNIAKEYNYSLFITDLVNSFYSKLVSRGAVVIKENDVVQITDDTNLMQKEIYSA